MGSYRVFDVSEGVLSQDELDEIVAVLDSSELLVMPTDTVYGVGSVPFDSAAVARLQKAKGRGEDFPPPVLVSATSVLKELLDSDCEDSIGLAQCLAQCFWPGALTIIAKANPRLGWDLGETGGTIALRMPRDRVALQILRCTGPLAVSSANKHALPPATDITAAQEYFGEQVSIYVNAGQSVSACPSTIVNVTSGEPVLIRQGDLSIEQIRSAL